MILAEKVDTADTARRGDRRKERMMKPKCIQRYGRPQHECRTPARWYYRNPQTKELEGPYCGRHARQFMPEALRPIEAYPQLAGAPGERSE